MSQKRSKQRVAESEMAAAVARYLRPAAREVAVDGHRFDIVAYDKRRKLFKLVECKRGSRATSIGRAFGQLVAYNALVSTHGSDFVLAAARKLHLSPRRLMESTEWARRIRVAFYVALTDDACKQVELLHSIKQLLPQVGIIRVKRDGHCRNFIRDNGEKNYKLTEASPIIVRILPGG